MENQVLKPAYQVGATVNVNFGNSKILKHCSVFAVKFNNDGKVLYDIEVPVGFEDDSTIIENVDSALITAYGEESNLEKELKERFRRCAIEIESSAIPLDQSPANDQMSKSMFELLNMVMTLTSDAKLIK